MQPSRARALLEDEFHIYTENFPPPETITEILDNLEAALVQFKAAQEELAKER